MRIAALDLETTDLKALMGIVLCGTLKPIVPDQDPAPYTFALKRTKANKFEPNPDKEIVVAIRDELEKYNAIVTWNGKMFDIPFLNARLMFHGERPAKPQFHMDMMYFARGQANRIGSSKLINVEKFLKLGAATEGGKTDIDWDTWKAAGLGDPAAMKEVIHHCEQDVRVLEEAYWRLLPNVANIHR